MLFFFNFIKKYELLLLFFFLNRTVYTLANYLCQTNRVEASRCLGADIRQRADRRCLIGRSRRGSVCHSGGVCAYNVLNYVFLIGCVLPFQEFLIHHLRFAPTHFVHDLHPLWWYYDVLNYYFFVRFEFLGCALPTWEFFIPNANLTSSVACKIKQIKYSYIKNSGILGTYQNHIQFRNRARLLLKFLCTTQNPKCDHSKVLTLIMKDKTGTLMARS